MFGQIAPRYDLLNRLMTGRQDIRWRVEVVRRLSPQPANRLLDIGAGTGDLAFAILAQEPAATVIASDFTIEMVRVGKTRENGDRLLWVIADAEHLPFPDRIFDGAVSGFLLRNVSNPGRALGEQTRTLKSGGQLVSLDTTPPKSGLMRPFVWIHLHMIIPALGWLVAGNAEAYTYLPDTTEKFMGAEQLAALMEKAGLETVQFVRKMLGTVAIHWGTKK